MKVSEETIQKIARNINAFDVYYHYIDSKEFSFWSKLSGTIFKVVNQLTSEDKSNLTQLCDASKAKYFNLV